MGYEGRDIGKRERNEVELQSANSAAWELKKKYASIKGQLAGEKVGDE